MADNCAISASEPLGTDSGAALSCNASHMDNLMNGGDHSYQSRTGKNNRSVAGMNADVDEAIRNAGGVDIGDYSSDPLITKAYEYVVFDRSGTPSNWKVKAGVPLPYQIDSATYPAPQNDPNIQPWAEAKEVNTDTLGGLTNYQTIDTSKMVQGITSDGQTIPLVVGQTWTIHGQWKYNGGVSGTISDFDSVGNVCIDDFNHLAFPDWSAAIIEAVSVADSNATGVYVLTGIKDISQTFTFPIGDFSGAGYDQSVFRVVDNNLDYAAIWPNDRKSKTEGIGIIVSDTTNSTTTLMRLINPQRAATMEKCRFIVGQGNCIEANGVYHMAFRDVAFEGRYVATPSSTNKILGTAWYQPVPEANNVIFDHCEFNFLGVPLVTDTTVGQGSNTMQFNQCAFQAIGEYIGSIQGWYVEFNNCYFEEINRNYSDIPTGSALPYSFLRGGAGDVVFTHSILNLTHIVKDKPLFNMIIGSVKFDSSTVIKFPENFTGNIIDPITFNDRGLLVDAGTVKREAFRGKSADAGGYGSATNTPYPSHKESKVSSNEYEFIGIEVNSAFSAGEFQEAYIHLATGENYFVNVEAEYNLMDDTTGNMSYLKSNMTFYISSSETGTFIQPKTTDNSQKVDTNGYMTGASWDDPNFFKFINTGAGFKQFHLVRSAKSFGGEAKTYRVKFKVRVNSLGGDVECGILPHA